MAQLLDKKKLGKQAEQFVAQSLIDDGYTICAYNYQKQFGEIDIIAQKNDTIRFIEVKFRTNPLFDVTAVITPLKQKKIIAVAKYYLAQESLNKHSVLFDVAIVLVEGGAMVCSYIENAFQG